MSAPSRVSGTDRSYPSGFPFSASRGNLDHQDSAKVTKAKMNVNHSDQMRLRKLSDQSKAYVIPGPRKDG